MRSSGAVISDFWSLPKIGSSRPGLNGGNLGFRVWGLGLRILWGLGFRV